MTASDDDVTLGELGARLDALTREADALEDDVRAAAERLRAGLAKLREEIEARAASTVTAGGHDPGADVDGARLTALDLVLRGKPRTEAHALLADEFPGIDAGLLLDEIDAGR